MIALVWIGVPVLGPLLGVLLVGAGFWLSRRSSVERELDERWSDGTERLPLKSQAASDEAEAHDA